MNLSCPNCKHTLSRIQLADVEVDHCNNCGGTLFDYNEINRITVPDAEKLSLMKETNDISGEEKLSPRDGSVLKRMLDESIPQHVTLLRSDSTQEVFAFADDLVNFKKAQESKLNYLKTWRIPLPALSSVIVFGFIAAVSISTVLLSSRLASPGSQAIQASELCRNGLQIFTAAQNDGAIGAGSAAVTCETNSPMTCTARALCDGNTDEFVFSNTPTRIHTGFIPATCTTVQLRCTEGNIVVETESQALQ